MTKYIKPTSVIMEYDVCDVIATSSSQNQTSSLENNNNFDAGNSGFNY